ncbi:MAG: SDR family oxidoreductase [Rhodospirillaceae bacterium]|jgi:3-oxoacyl-[acyl-carrier protein] reductase|nr:SDR family oxidoreductase [Rhodospirillaceae bacterium]MBT5243901.1 SDR family oxidoreductase [Rhodospirillaceae bacterium]MBT5562950.1 SDR family oxidoreductase [Rhodospirillaceae bacterium]MBT6241349.1 SDR family oxidoreductase [Rhodospirillaceae bacterium]
MIDFSNKVALVTGGSRGIGAATVKAMVSAGAGVVLHYGSNRKAAEMTAEEAGREQCHLVGADLNDAEAAGVLWRQALSWKGQIDIVVNNAGVFEAAARDCSDQHWQEVWQRTMQINLIATADLCRQAINHWQQKSVGGCIVNVASRAAFRGDGPDYWSYAASKGGMTALTKTLARAYSADGIYTYGVAPGFVSTDMALEAFDLDPTLKERVVSEIPMGDIAPPSEIANTICFLASGLATHASGQTIDVNGASYVR